MYSYNIEKLKSKNKIKSILTNKEIYMVPLYSQRSFDSGFTLMKLLVETGESSKFVREYLTKRKIPIGYYYIYKYEDWICTANNFSNRNLENNLTSSFFNPYFVVYNIYITDIKSPIYFQSENLFNEIMPSSVTTRKYDYSPHWMKATSFDIEYYKNEYKNKEEFDIQLDTLFSNCINEYLGGRWPCIYPSRDIYKSQREADKQKIKKMINKI